MAATGIVAGCASNDTDAASGDDSTPADHDRSDDGTRRATLVTTLGEIEVTLYGDRAPRTVDNFVGLATGDRSWTDPETGRTIEDQPLYEDLSFYRITAGYLIEGGDPTDTGHGGPGHQLDREFHEDLRHDDAGILSMATEGEHSSGSRFFMTLDAQPHLDDRHSVFGSVIDGMDVVEAIGSVSTDAYNRPTVDIVLESVTIDGGA